MKVGDRTSMGIFLLVCGGTFVGLALASAAKKSNILGPPRSAVTADNVEEKLKNLGK